MKVFNFKNLFLTSAILIVALVFFWRPNWTIAGDGFGYYAYFRSVVFDHNLDFSNEYQAFDRMFGSAAAENITPTGRIGNYFAVGTSILAAPFLLLARLLDFSPHPDSFYGLTGYSLIYQVAFFIAATFYFFIGLWFVYKILNKFFSEAAAYFGALSILATPLVFYLVYEPSMSHIFSFFAISGFIYFCLRNYNSSDFYRQGMTLGLWLGLATLVRWQNIILVILPLVLYFKNYYLAPANKKSFLFWFLGIFITAVSPQLIVWKVLYGSFLAIPQGTGFFNILHPEIVATLFSAHHGLFYWQPWLFLALIGLLVFWQKERWLTVVLWIILIIQVYINASVTDWFAGRAFGARRLSDYFVIFAIGLASAFSTNAQKLGKIVFGCIIITAIIFNLWLMFLSARGVINLSGPLNYFKIFNL